MKRYFLSLLVFMFSAAALWAQAQPAPKSTPPAETRRGTITGRVLEDGGRPLARVSVSARTVTSQGAALQAATDNEGRFRFKDLAAGLYTISAYVPGYVSETGAPNATYRLGDNVDLRMVKGSVITGTVKDARGEPIVGVGVRASSLRDPETVLFLVPSARVSVTDDRGVYRIYGLRAGNYIVSAGGSQAFTWPLHAYGKDLAIYYPGATTRDAASVVTVNAGDEAGGIDIRYRQEPGHAVSGQLNTDVPANYYLFTLTAQKDKAQFFAQTLRNPDNISRFAFTGLLDGDYLLTVQTPNDATLHRAAVLPVTVNGADVTGLVVTLKPLSALRGRIVRDETPWPAECTEKPSLAVNEVLLSARRRDVKDTDLTPFALARTASDANGNFTFSYLSGGVYQLSWQLLSGLWYVRAIELPGTAKIKAPNELPQLVTLKDSAELSGVMIRLASGGAQVTGRVVPPEGVALPAKLSVYLVPAEKEQAPDTLRYVFAEVTDNGAFELPSVPPGRYRLVIQPTPPAHEGPPFLKTASREKLRRAAETANQILDLKPCQRVAASLEYKL